MLMKLVLSAALFAQLTLHRGCRVFNPDKCDATIRSVPPSPVVYGFLERIDADCFPRAVDSKWVARSE